MGELRGKVDDGVRAFTALPYAQPPLGEGSIRDQLMPPETDLFR